MKNLKLLNILSLGFGILTAILSIAAGVVSDRKLDLTIDEKVNKALEGKF